LRLLSSAALAGTNFKAESRKRADRNPVVLKLISGLIANQASPTGQQLILD
jgi:hypothetical protein